MAENAIEEMYRQVGDLVVDKNGIALRGLLARHLVMPNHVSNTQLVMRKLAAISPDIFLNLMGQYRPTGKVIADEHYPQINRRPICAEITQAYELAKQAGLWRFDPR